MHNFYIDTSVIVPSYCEEQHTSRVKKFLKSLKFPPIISSLTLVELYSALSKKIRMKELKQEEAKKIMRLFNTHLKNGIYKKISFKSQRLSQAKKWMSQFNDSLGLRTLDALHLAIAAKNIFEIITLDKNLEKSAKFFNINCNLTF